MTWTIKYTATATKSIKELDCQIQRKIRIFLEDELANSENPREKGKGLTANDAGEITDFSDHSISAFVTFW